MTNIFHTIPSTSLDFNNVNVIIEIPKDSSVKYEYSNHYGCIKVDRILKTPLQYNFNYGDIPQTLNDGDGDPLDAIVLSRAAFYPGTVIGARIIGGLRMYDKGEFDYKVISVADDKYYEHIKTVGDLSAHEKQDIEYFLTHYKDLEEKVVTLDGWDGPEEAKKIIKDSMRSYNRENRHGGF